MSGSNGTEASKSLCGVIVNLVGKVFVDKMLKVKLRRRIGEE